MALLNSIISGDKPREKGAAFPVIMIHYTKLIPSEKNNYSVEGIKELANMIRLSGGIKQNLLARKKTADEYELIAGHRRRLAAKYLVEELGDERYAMLPVHVEKDGDTLSEINLILTNCGARERNDWEKMMEVERLTELIQTMQTGPENEQERFKQTFGVEPGISGRELRKVIAKALGLSETKVANLNHISKNLSPSLKERFREGEIGISVANEAAALSAEAQQELNQKEEIRIADVKQKKSVSESDTNSEQSEIAGQMDIADYHEYMPVKPDKEVIGESDNAETEAVPSYCPPEQHNCMREVWGTTPEEQLQGAQECKKCWDKWKERQKITDITVEKSVSESDTKLFDRNLLLKMIEESEGWLNAMGDDWREQGSDMFARHTMQIEAYHLLLEKYAEEGEGAGNNKSKTG